MEPLSLQLKIDARASLIGAFLAELEASLSNEPAGSLHLEIGAQREAATWRRETTPLEAGWYSTLQHVSAAGGHTHAFLRSLGEPCHVATAALLVRGAMESLSVVAWLLDDTAPLGDRSLRALSEAHHSTKELKKLYRDQGFRVDPPDLDSRGVAIEEALAGIERDGNEAGGIVQPRPGFTSLIDDHLFGIKAYSSHPPGENSPIYRFLSALAHGTKWAMNHFATPINGGTLVSSDTGTEFIEMLLFHLGLGFLHVGSLAHQRLEWANLLDHGADEFLSLGLCEVDLGS